ncbi:hypothetical protein HKW98_09185 [Stutzerimonas urumqiensis]|uniref:DUF6968 family protein n=1 Tax=Stutzerimonas urumqiensis TaxID=638269 RepID=UPI003BA8C00A
MPPFVERLFELDDKTVHVRFDRPHRAAGGEYQCRYTLHWPDHAEHGYACGEDGVQALMLAMKKVHIGLVESDAYKQGRLSLWGQADLDLPPTWGAGPLYYVAPRQYRP